MTGVAWVFVGAAAVATLVALLVFLVPLGRRGSRSLAGPGSGGGPPGSRAGSGSQAGSLARGFSFLHVSPRTAARRAGVHERLARAFARIDAVDPHEAPRRIGEALLQAGLAEAPRPRTPSAAPRPIPDPTRSFPSTRESTHD
jgi:hypothetical protein